MAYYLRVGTDGLDEASRHARLRDAVDEFRGVAAELGSYGQSIDASVHIAPVGSRIEEYPDYVLSVGPRGGIKIERA